MIYARTALTITMATSRFLSIVLLKWMRLNVFGTTVDGHRDGNPQLLWSAPSILFDILSLKLRQVPASGEVLNCFFLATFPVKILSSKADAWMEFIHFTRYKFKISIKIKPAESKTDRIHSDSRFRVLLTALQFAARVSRPVRNRLGKSAKLHVTQLWKAPHSYGNARYAG